MDPEAMKPFGLALLDYHRGKRDAILFLCRDDGIENGQPVAEFFRDAREYELESRALELCRGRVLDAGGGTGLHSLFLQDKGFSVTAIDVSPEAVQVMREGGVKNAVVSDVFSYDGGPSDTVIMMGHGIGMVETMEGLDRFLQRLPDLIDPEGQVLLTSLDVRASAAPENTAYREFITRAGRYPGEIRMKLRYGEHEGPFCGWLQVDPDTLKEHAAAPAGMKCEVVEKHEDGNYLARLSLK